MNVSIGILLLCYVSKKTIAIIRNNKQRFLKTITHQPKNVSSITENNDKEEQKTVDIKTLSEIEKKKIMEEKIFFSALENNVFSKLEFDAQRAMKLFEYFENYNFVSDDKVNRVVPLHHMFFLTFFYIYVMERCNIHVMKWHNVAIG